MDPSSPSRRSFIGSSLGMAAGVAAGGFFSGSDAYGAEGKKVRFALVGLGGLATNQLAPAFAKSKHCELKGIVTGTPAKEQKWADKYGIERRNIYNYETYDKIADNDEIDVIYIVLPNGMHAEYTIRAAQAGKHVFCEKPMANTADECRLMIAACEKHERKLGIGYRCQFEPHNLHCMELAREKVFGEIMGIHAAFGFKIGDPTQWRLDGKLAGGGPLMDVGIYSLQACRFLTDSEPISITATETKTDPVKFDEVEETLTWTMKMGNGVNCHCGTTYAFNGMRDYRAFCERGQFGLDPAYGYGGITGTSSKGPIKFAEIDQFAAEMDHFALCVRDGIECRVPGEEGLRDVTAIEAIYKAARTGEAVTL